MSIRSPIPVMLATCVALGACVPLPYASPPVRMSMGGGIAAGRAVIAGEDGARETRGAALASFRIGVSPLQLSPEMTKVADVGVGYAFDLEGQSQTVRVAPLSGPYLEAAYWPVVSSWGGANAMRLGFTANADLLTRSAPAGRELGVGLLGGVTLEYAHFCTTPFASQDVGDDSSSDEDSAVKHTDVVGVAVGELGAGVTLQGGYRWIGSQRYWTTMLNVTFRLPASAGVFLFWMI